MNEERVNEGGVAGSRAWPPSRDEAGGAADWLRRLARLSALLPLEACLRRDTDANTTPNYRIGSPVGPRCEREVYRATISEPETEPHDGPSPLPYIFRFGSKRLTIAPIDQGTRPSHYRLTLRLFTGEGNLLIRIKLHCPTLITLHITTINHSTLKIRYIPLHTGQTFAVSLYLLKIYSGCLIRSTTKTNFYNIYT